MYSLEVVRVVLEAKEGNSVGHHPDVASLAVKVWLAPMAIVVQNVNAVLPHGGAVVAVIDAVHGESCSKGIVVC